jgi:hypothetical protein
MTSEVADENANVLLTIRSQTFGKRRATLLPEKVASAARKIHL